ncbi:placenta growth factor [Nephila pilipes]|uniref:Placenta growth factor n=1 Tax=Nephila pilipes TaxID=299642 RepID=A0A8X6T3J4_NEPPI|nr:placenta growth factor [Nephila pilipes]
MCVDAKNKNNGEGAEDNVDADEPAAVTSLSDTITYLGASLVFLPPMAMTWPTLLSLFCVFLILEQASSHQSRHHIHRKHPNHEDKSGQVDEDERLALKHSERVAEAGSCDLPRLQTVHVSDHYPGRYFLPHCTLLHRCGKHAGCCGTDRLRCVAKEKEKVVLRFYSVRIMGHGEPAERKIEKLTFYNHTKCACSPAVHYSKHDL